MIDCIREHLSQEELLCQLAEEASELAKAALKLRRVYDGTNPTPTGRGEAFSNLLEEIADVNVAITVLGLDSAHNLMEISGIMDKKIERWYRRLEEAEAKKEPAE